ncbi:MAG: abortive infection family protein [Candidatus Accumulibacter similis]|nr:MAG: abortive infection family protein [Candidatus Accumulibacter similis]
MSNLTSSEKRKLERLFGMGSGYVLDFTNRTFAEFVEESVRRDINNGRYDYGSGSKANRLRGFWGVEGNNLVGKLIGDLIEYGKEIDAFQNYGALPEECLKIVARLKQTCAVADLDALNATADGRDFEAVAAHVREVIEKNQPEAGLDRLHTYVIKFVRTLCEGSGITITREKPLHSLFGEYVKRLRDDGHLESEMTARILKSAISVLEAFNDVRNNQSLAHDNPILNYDESLLIFSHVASSVRFIRTVEDRLKRQQHREEATAASEDGIPF